MSNSTVERDPFPITAAQLSGNFCETLFFGIYLVTCTFCIRTLLITGNGRERWRRPHEIRWMLTIIAFILFSICTFDTTLGLLHNFRAFIDSEDPEREFRNIADWINIARVSGSFVLRPSPGGRINQSQSVNQTIAMIIGDFVLVPYYPFMAFVFLRVAARYTDVGLSMDVDGGLSPHRSSFILVI